jgi:eukaryotic-like serine/threonine-protein kinase
MDQPNHSRENSLNWTQQRESFDQLIDQSPAEREAALQTLAQQSPDMAAALRELLAAHDKFTGITNQQGQALLGQAQQFVQAKQQQALVGMTVGAYQLIDEIGHGGMGTVWRAERRDGALAQTVAIKLLPPHRWDALSRKRFQAERQIVASLDHPNIAKLLDAGEVQGQPFFVMELVEGVSIVDYCRQHALTPRSKVALLQSALSALDLAHRNLAVHRDLKPANILVTHDGTVKLIDFGIAKFLSDANETATAQRFFSPNYAAPEQLLGSQQGVSIDVYQIGAVLYELLGGKPPFDFSQATPAEIEQSILHRVPKTPDPHQQDLSAIALKALRKLSSERYASVAELSEDLRRFLTHRPISARSGQFWYRTQKFLRRNALAVVASTAFTATVTGFAWHAYSQQIEIAKQRDLAVEEKQNAEAVTGFLVESFTPPGDVSRWPKTAKVADLLARSRRGAIANSAIDSKQRFRILEAVFNAQVSAGELEELGQLIAEMEKASGADMTLKRKWLSAKIKFIQAMQNTVVNQTELRLTLPSSKSFPRAKILSMRSLFWCSQSSSASLKKKIWSSKSSYWTCFESRCLFQNHCKSMLM